MESFEEFDVEIDNLLEELDELLDGKDISIIVPAFLEMFSLFPLQIEDEDFVDTIAEELSDLTKYIENREYMEKH